MKYCNVCAGANEDNALECKYCHSKLDTPAETVETAIPIEKPISTDYVNNSVIESANNVESYPDSLSSSGLVLWCIAFGLVPVFGLVMLNIVWGKLGGRNLFIMRLVNSICMFAPSILLILLLGFVNFI